MLFLLHLQISLHIALQNIRNNNNNRCNLKIEILTHAASPRIFVFCGSVWLCIKKVPKKVLLLYIFNLILWENSCSFQFNLLLNKEKYYKSHWK